MVPCHPLIIFPARPTVPFERLAQLLKDILVAAELEEYRSAGLITEQETLQLFLEQREAHSAVRSTTPTR